MASTNLCAPLGFANLTTGVYRSAYPRKKTWKFIKSLNLKSMICLSPSDLKDDLIDFCKEDGIDLIQHDIGHNQEPFVVISTESVNKVLSYLSGFNFKLKFHEFCYLF